MYLLLPRRCGNITPGKAEIVLRLGLAVASPVAACGFGISSCLVEYLVTLLVDGDEAGLAVTAGVAK